MYNTLLLCALLLRHLTQFEELELLKEFEKRESTFTGKYRAKKQEKSDLEVKVRYNMYSIGNITLTVCVIVD